MGVGRVVARAAVVCALVAGVAGCGGSTSGSPAQSVRAGGATTLAGAELRYGASVTQLPGAVYQPDVVLVGGASAIRSAQDDGMVWTIAGSAPNAGQLRVGAIMAATSLATGRILAVRDVGGDKQVVLGPVALTDVYEQLNLGSDQPVSLGQPLAYSIPASPTLSTPADRTEPDLGGSPAGSGASGGPVSNPPTAPPESAAHSFYGGVSAAQPAGPHQAVGQRAPRSGPLPGPGTPSEASAGDFRLLPYCCSGGAGVHVSYDNGLGRLVGDLGLTLDKPRATFHIGISGGHLDDATFHVLGAGAINFSFEAATKSSSGNVRSPLLNIPVAFTIPLGGVPFTVTLTQSISLSMQLAGQAAFSSRGSYAMSADLGFGYTHSGGIGVTTPSIHTQTSVIDNATSLSVGINAIRLTYNVRLSAGIGLIGFTAGPFVAMNATLAVDKDGSPPQTSLTAGCATAAVGVYGRFGVGYTIPGVVVSVVNAFLKLLNARPIAASGGQQWGPYTLWNPGPAKRCLQRN